MATATPPTPARMEPISFKADSNTTAKLRDRATQASVTLSAYCAWLIAQALQTEGQPAAPAAGTSTPSSTASPQLMQLTADSEEMKDLLATLTEMVSDRLPTNLSSLCSLAEERIEGLTESVNDDLIAQAEASARANLLIKLVEDGNVLLFTGEAPGGRKVAKALMSGLGESRGPELVEKLAHLIHTAHDRTGFIGRGNDLFNEQATELADEAATEAEAWKETNPKGQEWKGVEVYTV